MNELIVNLRNLVAIKGWNVAELSRQLNISPISAKGLLTKDDVKPRNATLKAIEDLLAGKTKVNAEAAKPKTKATKAAKPKARKGDEVAPESEPTQKAKVKQTRKPKIKEPEVDVERMVMLNLLSEVGLMDEVIRRVTMVKGDSQ